MKSPDDEYSDGLEAELESLRKQNLEQAAQIEMMRNELLLMTRDKWHWQEARDRALSTTPSQALEAFAAKVREQCIERLNTHHFVTGAAYHSTVSAIKGIKELP